jgi:hypothetical protein
MSEQSTPTPPTPFPSGEPTIGERVTWPAKGWTRTGTVAELSEWGNYAYVRRDGGEMHYVNRAKLTRVEQAAESEAPS